MRAEATVHAVPAGVNSSGNNENTPAAEAIMNVRKYAWLSAASKLSFGQYPQLDWLSEFAYLRGARTSSMAFSCTCQPNMKEVHPHSVRAVTNDLYVGARQSLTRYI